MSKKLISRYLGMEEYVHTDNSRPNDLIIETRQDLSPVIDHVLELRDRPLGKEWRHVAEIPMYFFDQWAKEGSLHDKTKIRKWLDDPQNKPFRVWQGRMGKTTRGM